jgi:hypothetical protein
LFLRTGPFVRRFEEQIAAACEQLFQTVSVWKKPGFVFFAGQFGFFPAVRFLIYGIPTVAIRISRMASKASFCT